MLSDVDLVPVVIAPGCDACLPSNLHFLHIAGEAGRAPKRPTIFEAF